MSQDPTPPQDPTPDQDPTHPQDDAAPPPPTPPPPPAAKRYERSRSDRMVAGVAGGLAAYFGIDALLVRLAFVVLVIVTGGLGLIVYGAAWALAPESGEAAAPIELRSRGSTAVTIVLVAIAAAIAIPAAFVAGWFVVPLLVLGSIGLFVWWLSGGRPQGGTPRSVVLGALVGVGLLFLASVLFLAGVWGSATGGGTVVAILVIAAGVALVAGAFVRPVRWLVVPALGLALGAGFAAAAGADGGGGVGEREYRPVTASDVRGSYELGVGRLVVDLREAELRGEHRLRLDVGVGQAVLIVPDDVCVSTAAQVGMGGYDVFQRGGGGVDVDWEDGRRAPVGTARVVLDADVGIGHLQVGHADASGHWDDDEGGDFGGRDFDAALGRNAACA